MQVYMMWPPEGQLVPQGHAVLPHVLPCLTKPHLSLALKGSVPPEEKARPDVPACDPRYFQDQSKKYKSSRQPGQHRETVSNGRVKES